MPVTFDTETIRLITLFENLTGVHVRDCITEENNTIYFLIEEGEVGKAIGKNGINIKHTENLIKKNIKIFEFSNDVEKFIKNLIPQANFIKIKNENDRSVAEIWVDKKDKPVVISRDGRKLKLYKELLQRNHDISDVTVR